MFDKCYPNLMVGSVEETLEFYSRVLGFQITDVFPPQMPFLRAVIRREDIIFLLEARREAPAPARPMTALTFFAPVSDVQSLYNTVRRRAVLYHDLHHTRYGSTEFAVQDPNGFILVFSQKEE